MFKLNWISALTPQQSPERLAPMAHYESMYVVHMVPDIIHTHSSSGLGLLGKLMSNRKPLKFETIGPTRTSTAGIKLLAQQTR